jgi:hypothetical protein
MKMFISLTAFFAGLGTYAWNTGDFGVPFIATVCLGLIMCGIWFDTER